jgi:hypothetical protein
VLPLLKLEPTAGLHSRQIELKKGSSSRYVPGIDNGNARQGANDSDRRQHQRERKTYLRDEYPVT